MANLMESGNGPMGREIKWRGNGSKAFSMEGLFSTMRMATNNMRSKMEEFMAG